MAMGPRLQYIESQALREAPVRLGVESFDFDAPLFYFSLFLPKSAGKGLQILPDPDYLTAVEFCLFQVCFIPFLD